MYTCPCEHVFEYVGKCVGVVHTLECVGVQICVHLYPGMFERM